MLNFKKIFRRICNIPRRLIIIPSFYYYEIWRRKKFTSFDFVELSKPFEVPSLFSYTSNRFYGINAAVKHRLNRLFLPVNFVIEHGIYFSDQIMNFEVNFCKHPLIITMGKQRERLLKEKGYNALSVGPYIRYSKNYSSFDELARLKQKLGKTLLVFPSHSIEGVDAVFNGEKFVAEIKKCSENFNTVLICMYWKDIVDNRYQEYLNNGFTIVTAGHRSDSSFLSRLKDLIYLSDMTMSNNLGTHLGYCISEGKPHYLFSQECTYTGVFVKREQRYSNATLYNERLLQFKEAFGVFANEITQKQLDLVHFYWGDF